VANKIFKMEKKVQRHSPSVRFVHWSVVVSTFVLIFSGFGQMPMYARYYLDTLPGLWWSSDYSVTLPMHYIAAAVLMFAVGYHIVFHLMRKEFGILPRRGDIKESCQIIKAMLTNGEEPPSDKFLAEQRLAYVFIAFWFLVVIITGVIKVLKNLSSITFDGTFMVWTNDLHTFASFMIVFGIIAHLGAFIFKSNRPLIMSMFTGKIDLRYVKHRHSLWYERLQGASSKGCESEDQFKEGACR
jgi:formate dehydrogenase gamma subunit